MKILGLYASNFKRLRAVEIIIDGETQRLVVIRGRNGQGKSSVLDVILCAFGGGNVLPKQPIHRGAEVGRIQVDCGEIIVTRRFTAAGSTLTLEAASGARFRSPQHMLDEIYTAVALDVGEFARMKPEKRLETLRPMIKFDVDLDVLDGLNAKDYEARTEVNRDARRLRGQASGIQYPADLPAVPVDVSALTEALAQAGRDNATLERRKARREAMAGEAAGNRHTAKGHRERAAKLRQEAEELESKAEDLESTAAEFERAMAEAAPLPDPVDTKPMVAAVETAHTTNAHLEAKTRRETLEAEAAALEQRSADLTAAMEERTRRRTQAIANAKMPIEGLGYADGDDDVTLNGIPFDQASQAEKIRAGVELAIAAQPRLRVLCIRDGSLLDRDSWRVLEDLAEKHDFQFWIELTDDDARTGIIIEDGTVVVHPDPETKQTKQPSLALVQV